MKENKPTNTTQKTQNAQRFPDHIERGFPSWKSSRINYTPQAFWMIEPNYYDIPNNNN